MTKEKKTESQDRMIHIRLPVEVHKQLRIRAAEMDMTIQDWVAEAVVKELKRQGKEIDK